jgi:hypothetical protein
MIAELFHYGLDLLVGWIPLVIHLGTHARHIRVLAVVGKLLRIT